MDEASISVDAALVAALLARPDFVAVVQLDERSLEDPTLRAVHRVLQSKGAAYATPAAMLAALDELPDEIDTKKVYALFQLAPDDTQLDTVLKLKEDVDAKARDREFERRLERAKVLSGTDKKQLVSELRKATDWYDKTSLSKYDPTAEAQIEELYDDTDELTRWKIGCLDLDEMFEGIGPDGEYSNGALGQSEVTMLLASYGVGKSRLAYNWEVALLKQGASITHVILEDSVKKVIAKIIAAYADVKFSHVLMHTKGKLVSTGKVGDEYIKRIENGIAWYKSLGKQLRIHDGAKGVNVFDFEECLKLLQFEARYYKTNFAVIDYVQAFRGTTDYQIAADIAKSIREFAQRYNVGVVALSQVSNETRKWGSGAGEVAAKGAGDFGEMAHLGIELEWQPEVGSEELCLSVKKARDGQRIRTYARFNPSTGKLLSYQGTPLLMSLPEEKKTAKKKVNR